MASKSQSIVRRPLRGFILVSAVIALAALMGTSDAWAKGSALAAGATPVEATQGTESQPALGEGAAASSRGGSATTLGQTYAAREASSKGLEDFKGGDVVIIGSGALLLVLLVMLVLLI